MGSVVTSIVGEILSCSASLEQRVMRSQNDNKWLYVRSTRKQFVSSQISRVSMISRRYLLEMLHCCIGLAPRQPVVSYARRTQPVSCLIGWQRWLATKGKSPSWFATLDSAESAELVIRGCIPNALCRIYQQRPWPNPLHCASTAGATHPGRRPELMVVLP